MFSFFKAKQPVSSSNCKWSVCTFTMDDKQFLLRRNDSVKKMAGHSEYDHSLGVAFPILSPDANGLPGSEEFEIINQIEDALIAAVEENQEGIYVLSITGGSVREFVFYTRTPNDTIARLKNIFGQFPNYQLGCYVAKDPGWERYTNFS